MQLQHIILKNQHGFKAEILNYGATLWKFWVPDKEGSSINVVIGLKDASDYLSSQYTSSNYCLGATIGRYAGRISNGGFYLHDQFFPLNNEITLHGGNHGFQHQYWEVITHSNTKATLRLDDAEGLHGFPGNLEVFAHFELLENGLKICYEAQTDTPTVFNMTNHAYFNLNGSDSIKDHALEVNATHLCETNSALIPTGILSPIAPSSELFHLASLEKHPLDTPFLMASKTPQAILYNEANGIEMQVHTNQPAMVIFTPQYIEHFALNAKYSEYPAICFECQYLPDAPNHKHFPSTVLKPNEMYSNETSFQFGIR